MSGGRPRRLRDSELRDMVRRIAAECTAEYTAAEYTAAEVINELSDRIYKQITSRGLPRWSIVRLEWDNMMKYGEGSSIDFGTLRGVLSSIVGPNDAGKSSVLDILTFALYGESSRVSKHTIERIGKGPADRSWTSVWICTLPAVGSQDSSPIMYRVDREVSHGRTPFLRVYARQGVAVSSAVQWSIQPWGTIAQTQQRLAAVIGDVELFKNIALSAPGDVNICNCNYTDRLRLFAHMFGITGLTGDSADTAELCKRRDVLGGTLAGMQRAAYADPTMGMTANEITWLEEKFSGVDCGALAAELRAQLACGVPRDTILVHSEYEEAAGMLREAIGGGSTRCVSMRWNPKCPECARNRSLYGDGADHSTIESLSADRDRLAAEYAACRRYDYARLELAYVEKYIIWSSMKNTAVIGDEITAEIAAVERKLKINELIKEIIDAGVITKRLCDWYIGGIISTANAVLGCMGCEFSLAAETVSGGLKLLAVSGRTRVPVELGGGFQRFACDLAIRAAISRRCGGPDILIIDEGFDCMDAVNRFRCIDTFPMLVKIFKVFVVVSHLENIAGEVLAEHRLAIQMINGVCRLRNTPRQLSIPEKPGRK